MQKNIMDRLFQSLTELESAINGAKTTLLKNGNPALAVIERLNSYDEILQKQRNLAGELCVHINRQEWDEVNRHVSLINSLSSLIRDDARSILSSLSANSDFQEEEDYTFC